MLMVKMEIMAMVIMLRLLTTVGDDDDDCDHAHHHADCREEMMLTTVGSPPWVATCSKGAGAAAFGKKMLIRLPIFSLSVSSNALQEVIGYCQCQCHKYLGGSGKSLLSQ